MNLWKNRWQGRIMLILMVGAALLAACQSSTPSPTSTSTVAAVPTPAEQSTLQTYTLPTAAPLVLEGATVTESGLQYLELVPGDGALPKAGDLITMHYIVTLPDGTELANSYIEGQPFTTLWGRNRLLTGWEEGVGLMRVNGKSRLVLPPELAFGAEGSGSVPPNSQIMIDVELLAAKPAPMPTAVAIDQLETTASGLQYYDLVVGQGKEAIKNYTVATNYTLWVKTDGGYDYIVSSADGAAVEFVLGRGDTVFPGWEEGANGMRVGGKRLLVIPANLGLGNQSMGAIPANAVMVMEIELIDSREPRMPVKVDEKDYTVTATGLKYYDLVPGTGETATSGSTVVVHYTGWLEDGTQFDSSIDRGEAFTFVLGSGNVIPGWDEGVATMKVGGKRQLVIPPGLGYGETGAGSLIPPNATLIFEVELLEIRP